MKLIKVFVFDKLPNVCVGNRTFLGNLRRSKMLVVLERGLFGKGRFSKKIC